MLSLKAAYCHHHPYKTTHTRLPITIKMNYAVAASVTVCQLSTAVRIDQKVK